MARGEGDETSVTNQVRSVLRVVPAGWTLAATPGAPHDPRNPDAGTWPNGHYVDNDVRISRGHPQGSQYHRMIADVQTGLINTVAATQGDRLWRNRLEAAQTLDLFEELGIWVLVNGQTYNCKDPSHVAMLEQLGVFARLESRRHGVRIDGAAYERALAGKIDNGPVPFGNRSVWTDDVPRKFLGWEPNHDDGSWDRARLMVKEEIQGVLSHAEIARRVNADGYRTSRGNEWTGDTLRQYLLSPWVRGIVTYTGAVPDGEPPFTPVPGTNFTALVPDPDEQEMLRLALGTGPDKGGHHKRDDPQHLLTGFARCGRVLDASDGRGECPVCGYHLTLDRDGKLTRHNPASGGWNVLSGPPCAGQDPLRMFPHDRAGEVCGAVLTNRVGTSNGQPAYQCPAWPRGCGKLSRNEADTDRWVTANLLHWLSGPKGAYDRAVSATHAEDPAVSELHAKQTTDKALLPPLLDKLGDGLIADDEYATQKARIQGRINDRQAIIDRKATRQRAAVITERGKKLSDVWKSGRWNLEKKRAVLATFLDHVDVLPARQGPIPFDPSKVIVVPLAAWADDAPAGSLAAPFTVMNDGQDPRKRPARNPVPARDRVLNWLTAHPDDTLTAVDVMTYGLTDARDIKATRLLLWRMEKAGELDAIRGTRGRQAIRYTLPE
jgi:DNA invertase Pin-like site-specific DNA recombinase